MRERLEGRPEDVERGVGGDLGGACEPGKRGLVAEGEEGAQDLVDFEDVAHLRHWALWGAGGGGGGRGGWG